ncbi:uncharacterized protein [Apostichopus japonicus]|uniref:uncharacterized protein isoform X2 n=1 Tax=Stichopus japonicus TaxID=307972 RepID=UPI003AB1EE9C
MSLFSGMKIKQKEANKAKEDQPSVSENLQDLNCAQTQGISSQFDFILADNMGQNLTNQAAFTTEDQLTRDPGKSDSRDETKGYLSSTTGKLTNSMIGQGNALVDKIKRSLHIDPLDEDCSSSISFNKDGEEIKMENSTSFGEIDVPSLRISCTEDDNPLLVDMDSELQHNLEYSAEEKFQILQQGHRTRLKHISEKKELLRNEVLKITAGRIGSILSITSKQKKLQELQTEQVQAVETEDYEKAESLAMQCTALESELNILPDMSLNTHFIMEELLKSALELQEREQATQEKLIKETKRVHKEVSALATRFEEHLLDTEVKDKKKVEKLRLEMENEESHFKEDVKKFKEQEADLQERISEKSQDHEKRKSELETKRGIIQTEIKEMEEKLTNLRQTEAELTASIIQEDEEIVGIVGSYQLEVQALEIERQNNQLKDGKLQEMIQKVMNLQEKRKQELELYRKEKERHEKLKAKIEKILETDEKLHDEMVLVDTWTIQSPPSFHPTKELSQARVNFKDHENKMKIARKKLVQGQKKVVSLRKQVTDLEGHIAELEQSKKLSVEGKQFSEAKNLSEEIQRVTSEGQRVQEELEGMTKANQEIVSQLQDMQAESQKLKECEDSERSSWEEQLRDRLVSHFRTLYEDREKKLVQINCAASVILQSELQTSCLLLKHLCQKLNFSLSQEVADKMEEVLDGIEIPDAGEKLDYNDLGSNGDFTSELRQLEADLKQAVDGNNFEKAEDLQGRINHFEKANLGT